MISNNSPIDREVKIIGIAGASGSGKSTLADLFYKKYPHQCAVVRLDDYYKRKEDVSSVGDITNWDHPDALRFNDLYKDLASLKEGQSITLFTRSELGIYSPKYDEKGRVLKYIIEPKSIIFFEGYLAFYDNRVRKLLDFKVYLDIPVEESIKRRALNKFIPNDDYLNQVLLPVHKKFVGPTKQYADLVIDVSRNDSQQVFEILQEGMCEKSVYDFNNNENES